LCSTTFYLPSFSSTKKAATTIKTMVNGTRALLMLSSTACGVASFTFSPKVPQLLQHRQIASFPFKLYEHRKPLYNKPPTHLHEKKSIYANEVKSANETEDKATFTGDMPFFSVEEINEGPKQLPMQNVLDDFDDNNNSLVTPPTPGPYEGLLWRGVVVILCALWASNFAAAKLVMSEPGVDSSLYAVSRFSVAALALIPGSIAAVRRGVIDWDTAKGAAICGSWVSFGYLGQTLGLLTTTASRSCVICTLHCVFVAAVAEFMRVQSAASEDNKTFDFKRLIPAAVAVIGVAIVELKGAGGAPSIGDLLSFAQPIGFGMGYLQLEELVRKKPDAGLPISAIKLIMVTIFSFIMFELFPLLQHQALEFRIPDFTPIISSPLALGGIMYTGLITTALALWVESIAFKRVPATDASIILTTEPLFAALAGALTLGETFGTSDYFGAALIIGACAIAVLLDDEGNEDKPIMDTN
jgi:drug/metabolite transporter (DMT)-like permease